MDGKDNQKDNQKDTTIDNKNNTNNILDNNNPDSNSGDNDGGNMGNINDTVLDMIKEKDEKIEQLQKDITELKKSNANLLVRVSAGERHQEKSFEENLLGLVGQPTERN